LSGDDPRERSLTGLSGRFTILVSDLDINRSLYVVPQPALDTPAAGDLNTPFLAIM
jgi:hypothetical protein